MSLEGHIENGVVVFDQPAPLPEGTRVRVEPVKERKPRQNQAPTLLERLGDVVGKAEGLPDDAALNVDHYLYGHPKK